MFASFTQQAIPSSIRLIHIRQSLQVRNKWGSWVTGVSPPKIAQLVDPELIDLTELGDSLFRHLISLNHTRYTTQGTSDPDPQGLPEVDSEEEANRMGSRNSKYEVSRDTPLSNQPPLPPPGRHDILRDSMRRFANWVFGPRGLPNLQVIALGDFSHGRGSNGQDNMFLVRGNSSSPSLAGRTDNFAIFWLGEKRSQDWAELVDRNQHVLEACPSEPLVDYHMV